VLIGVFTGFLLGGLVGVALLATGRATSRTAIPFGPFMMTGALAALFLAGPIAGWYTSLLISAA
jgi:leader peptidase (prepilin peptidase)/N-methyltransferase